MAHCTNCGASGWEDRQDFECPKCGFKKTEAKQAETIYLIFCATCQCHYGNVIEACPHHGIGSHILSPHFPISKGVPVINS
jgi:hypothetical protein